jgi:hypothetical protein
MTRRLLSVATAAALSLGLFSVTAETAGAAEGDSRESVYSNYYTHWLPIRDIPSDWSGNTATCTDSGPSAAVRAASLAAVNYFRNLAGLHSVTEDPVASAKAQQTALMMAAQGDLSHYPGTNWACYSADGAQGAGSSNLFLGLTGPQAVFGFLTDPGDNNAQAVGHRRWILDPRQQSMGFGIVGPTENNASSMALWVFNPFVNRTDSPAIVGWPTAGYFPAQLEPEGRWSVSVTDPDWDLSQATVSVSGPSGPVAIVQQDQETGFGPDTVVFQMVNPVPQPSPGAANDQAYTVTVTGIRDGGTLLSPQTYTTTLFQTPEGRPSGSRTFLDFESNAVGSLITASAWWAGGDTPAESWQWQRDGVNIVGATGPTYRITAADAGHTLRAVVMGRSPTYADVTLTTETVAVWAPQDSTATSQPSVFVNGKRPVISGKAKVGKSLRVTKGTWNVSPAKVTYQWYRGSKAIKGATKAKYKVTRKDRHRKLSVKVTVKRTGFVTSSVRSSPRRVK